MFETTIEDRQTHLLVECRGDLDPEEVREAFERVRETARTSSRKCILLDWRHMSNPESEVHFLAGADIARLLPRPYKVAGLSRPEEITDSANAGASDHGPDFRVFADEDEALLWLLFEPARRGGSR